MAKEYFFNCSSHPEFALNQLDEMFERPDGRKNSNYLVSNDKSTNAHIYAPEINFYLNNSKDEIGKKLRNIRKLYDTRATAFESAQDIEKSIEVRKKILIVSSDNGNSLGEELEAHGFSSMLLHPSHITEVRGSIGSLGVSTKIDGKIEDYQTDQLIWFGMPQTLAGRSGIHDPEIQGIDKTIEQLEANCGTYCYKNSIKYTSSICQYHQRRHEVCGKCADICPTRALSKIAHTKQLTISDIDCIGCGRCVGICPSGALDYAAMPTDSFTRICSHYKESIPLIIPSRIDLESLHLQLKENVLPLIVENDEFLHEYHFLALLQTTGNPIILYTDGISTVTGNVICILNEIFSRRFGRQAIFTCNDANQLCEIYNNISPIENSLHDVKEVGLKKREAFSVRLAHIVGDNDMGIIHTGPHIDYANLTINQNTCTLCLSCAEACSAGALTAHPEDNTLRFNPSLCTGCGYCEMTCPEPDCLKVIHNQLSLHPDYFRQNVLARDELFKCTECGVGFAPAKSIAKIADMMKPFFGDDKAKIRTLSCCPACKVKVMLESQAL